jgi:hypothetical protein
MGTKVSNSNEMTSHDGRRHRLSQEDSEFLIQAFAQNPRPNQRERNEISDRLGLNSRSIQVWFQNRRAKLKKESNDPDLFSGPRRSNKTNDSYKITAFEDIEYQQVTAATARNFKELCLPSYLDIPIKGHHFSAEDLSKNEAIKRFWRNHQMIYNESEAITDASSSKNSSTSSTPSKEKGGMQVVSSTEHRKKSKPSSPDLIEDDLATLNMPDLIPFKDISSSYATKKSGFDVTDLSFLTKSIKEINDKTAKMNPKYFCPQLDTSTTNMDFLFNPNSNTTSALDTKEQHFSDLIFFPNFESEIN